MNYVLTAFLMVIIAGLLVFHFLSARDWKHERDAWSEERFVLIQAAMAKDLPEFRRATSPPPEMYREPWPADDEIPIGL